MLQCEADHEKPRSSTNKLEVKEADRRSTQQCCNWANLPTSITREGDDIEELDRPADSDVERSMDEM